MAAVCNSIPSVSAAAGTFIFYSFVTVAAGAAAPLGVKHKVGEVLLLGFDAEVVVSNAVPLVV